MAEYDTVPPEADAKQNALEQPGVAEHTDDEKDAPQKPLEDRKDPISSSEDGSSGSDSSPPYYDCPDVGCTWPCAHHVHWCKGYRNFLWYPALKNLRSYHPEIPKVQSEMKVGRKDCQFCRIFFTIGQSDCACGANAQNDHIPKSGGCRCASANCWFRSNGQVELVRMGWECGYAGYELGLSTAPGRDFPYIAPCMGDLHYDPGSDESLALMKGWINDCQHRHQLCMKMPQQVDRPKRLLQCLSGGLVKLVETTQHCDYIALSYCWGDGKAVLKTTEVPNTLDRHQSGIPDKDLPPLYQEVVALARGLNIRYLWIDSLCILQDSPEDKMEEISKMSDIFCGALVVVVAATAESPLGSLLGVKPQDQSHTWRTASLASYQEMDLEVKFRKRISSSHAWTDATYLTPISRRAWCFQEKLLASRCLVFCEDEVCHNS